LVTLTNNDQFVIIKSALVPVPARAPDSGPQPNYFSPTENILHIAGNAFAPGNGLTYVQSLYFGSHARVILWSGPTGSVIGTINCTGHDGSGPCTLEHLILSSPHRIRNFGIVPPPHSGMGTGSLWFWTTLRPGEEALVGYTFAYDRYLLGRT
jgi:hypothetical protein